MTGNTNGLFDTLPEHWKWDKISNLCHFIVDCLHSTPSVVDYPTGYYMIRTSDVRDGHIDLDSARHVAKEVYNERVQRGIPIEGDIVITREAPLGEVGRVPSGVKICLGQRLIHYRPDKDQVEPRFLLYALLSPLLKAQFLANMGTGSIVDNLRMGEARRLKIPLPPLAEQRAIAHILGTLDDKIELNRRMNATLEAIARAIFKSWFVDFDPVRAKMLGEQPVGMDAATAALFPDAFEDSELGPIPAGWGVEPLDKIAHFQNGLALQNYPPEGDDYLPVIKIRELRQGYADDRSDKASPNIKEECILYDGDVVFSWSGSLLVDIWCAGTAALNQHLFKVTSSEHPKWFYYYWTLYHLEEFQRIAADKATTMGHIKREHLSRALTAVPPQAIMERADEVLALYLEAQINNRLQSRTLAALRDMLLPKLISGEIRVEEATS